MRYSMGVELDFINASAKALGTEIRLGILEGLLQLGHEVTVLSTIPKKHLHILDGIGSGYNYKIFKNLKYESIKVPKMDLLLIESSVANVFFAQRNIERLIQVMLEYDGPICYYHHADQLSSFPLGAMIDGERSNFEETENPSYRNIFKELDKQGVVKDRQFILLTHAVPKFLKKRMNTNRFRYSRFDKSVRMPVGYSEIFDNPHSIIPIKKRKYDLVYIGKEKSNVRTKRIINLYGGDDCSRLLYGNWNNIPDGFNYKGYVEGHGKVYSEDLWGWAKASIVTADSWFTDIGMMTTRMIQSIRSQCLTLIDNNFLRSDQFLGKEYVVNNHEDVHRFLDMSNKHLKEEIEQQQYRIHEWSIILEFALNKMGVS